MKRLLLLALGLLAGALLAACASGPKFSEISKSIEPVAAGDGRIYFFRSSSMMGAALQPDIRLNGQVVGTSKPGGFFYIDRPAGHYKAATETEKPAVFELDAGETKYVRTSPSFGLLVGHVTVELEDPVKARAEIETLSLSGRSTKAAAAAAPAPAVEAAPTGPTTLASVLAAAQTQAPAQDVLRHLNTASVDGTEWVFPSYDPKIFRDVHLVFRDGNVEAFNQHDHTSGTYTVAGDKVCVDLQSRRWGKVCYVVIEARAGDVGHGLEVMELPNGARQPLAIH